MDEPAVKIGVVALVFSMLAIALAIISSENVITDNLNMDNYYIDNTNVIRKHIWIPASNLGRNPTNPPVIDIYGICYAAEFTVGTDRAHFKLCLPDDWVSGTNMTINVHWTRSTTGSDESTKTVCWQLKSLTAADNTNINSGETTENVQDTYEDSNASNQVRYTTDDLTVSLAGASITDCVILELSAVTPTGTALSEPALLMLMISYTTYQVQPPP